MSFYKHQPCLDNELNSWGDIPEKFKKCPGIVVRILVVTLIPANRQHNSTRPISLRIGWKYTTDFPTTFHFKKGIYKRISYQNFHVRKMFTLKLPCARDFPTETSIYTSFSYQNFMYKKLSLLGVWSRAGTLWKPNLMLQLPKGEGGLHIQYSGRFRSP